jgi:hypothetical protein
VKQSVPKWVTTLLLVLDHLLQYKVLIRADAPGGAATTAETSSRVDVKSNLTLSDGETLRLNLKGTKTFLLALCPDQQDT